DEVLQPVTARVRVDERLPGDLRRGVRRLRIREVRARLLGFLRREAMHVAVDLTARGEDDRQALLAAELEHVERHHRVLERTMRLAHELMHLRVRGEVDDEVDVRVLDAADAAGERRIVPGEILEEIAEHVRPRVQALVDAKDVVAVRDQPQREVRADLPRRAGDENPHAAAATACAPRSVVEVAASIRTSTSSPGSAVPVKFTVVFRRVRPRNTAGSVRLGPSTSTSSTRPTRASLHRCATRWTTSTRRSIRSRFTSSAIWSSIDAASVPARGE